MCPTPPAPPGHSFSEDCLAGYALHRLPGAAQGTGQLHQNSGKRHDPRRDDPKGEEGVISVILSNYRSFGKQYGFCMRWLTRSCVQSVTQRSKSIGLKLFWDPLAPVSLALPVTLQRKPWLMVASCWCCTLSQTCFGDFVNCSVGRLLWLGLFLFSNFPKGLVCCWEWSFLSWFCQPKPLNFA